MSVRPTGRPTFLAVRARAAPPASSAAAEPAPVVVVNPRAQEREYLALKEAVEEKRRAFVELEARVAQLSSEAAALRAEVGNGKKYKNSQVVQDLRAANRSVSTRKEDLQKYERKLRSYQYYVDGTNPSPTTQLNAERRSLSTSSSPVSAPASSAGLAAAEYDSLNPQAKAAVLAQTKKYGTTVPVQGKGYVIGGKLYAQPRTEAGVTFLKKKALQAGASAYITQRTAEAAQLSAKGFSTAGETLRTLQGRTEKTAVTTKKVVSTPVKQGSPTLPVNFAGQMVTMERNDPISVNIPPLPLPPARLEATPQSSTHIFGKLSVSTESEKLFGMAGRDFEKVKGFVGGLKTDVPTLKETGEAFAAAGTGTARYFAGGTRETIKGIGENPVEAAVTFGLYAGSVALFGPAGPAGLFGTQNVIEVVAGEKPSVVSLAENPARGAGQLLPYAAAGAGLNLAATGVKGVQLTNKYRGVVAQGVKDLPSVDILVEPVVGVKVKSQTVTRAGATARLTTSVPEKGEPFWTTGEELQNQPKNFLVEAQLNKMDYARPSSVRPTIKAKIIDLLPGKKPRVVTVEESVTAPSVSTPFFTEVTATRGGVISAEALKEAMQPTATFSVNPSKLAPTLVGDSRGVGTVRFQGIELATTKEVALRGFKTGGKSSTPKPAGPDQLYPPSLYGPQIDFFKEVFFAEEGGSSLSVRQSAASGKLLVERTGPPPLIIKKVTPAATPAKTAISPGLAGEGVAATGAGDQLLLLKQKPAPVVVTIEESASQALQKPESVAVTKIKMDAKVAAKPTLSDLLGPQRRSRSLIKASPSRRLGTLLGPAQTARSSARTSPALAVGTAAAQASAQQAGQLSAQDSAQQAATTTLTLPATATTSIFQTPRPPPSERITTTFRPPRLSSSEKKGGGELFSVAVRRRGKFSTVSPRPLPLREASRFGRLIVEQSAAASFKVMPVGKAFATEKAGAFAGPRFLASKREKNVFVQKNRFRISSAGEKREITLKGIMTSRKPKSFQLW